MAALDPPPSAAEQIRARFEARKAELDAEIGRCAVDIPDTPRPQWRKRDRQKQAERRKRPGAPREHQQARRQVYHALRAGRMTAQPCELCGSEQQLEAHHVDYERPLDVMWLCARCHRLVERGNLKGLVVVEG